MVAKGRRSGRAPQIELIYKIKDTPLVTLNSLSIFSDFLLTLEAVLTNYLTKHETKL